MSQHFDDSSKYGKNPSWIVKRYWKCGRKLWNDIENMEEKGKDMKNTKEKISWIVKIYGKYGRKGSWIVERFGKYGRKVSWIVKWYGKYGRKVSWKVKRFGKYRRKLWNEMENMEEK
jgi:hypothetical protein